MAYISEAPTTQELFTKPIIVCQDFCFYNLQSPGIICQVEMNLAVLKKIMILPTQFAQCA